MLHTDERCPGELTIEFISWLAAKSLEGRIFWERGPHLITTTVTDESVMVQFVTSLSVTGEEAWRLLTICDPTGEELFRVTEASATVDTLPVDRAVDMLFFAAATSSRIQ
jgi:hypothetical protein